MIKISKAALSNLIDYLQQQVAKNPESEYIEIESDRLSFPIREWIWNLERDSGLYSLQVTEGGLVGSLSDLLKLAFRSNLRSILLYLYHRLPGISLAESLTKFIHDFRVSPRKALFGSSKYPIGPVVIMPAGDKEGNQKLITEFIDSATSIVICDPFFFHVPKGCKAKEYVQEILSVLPIDSLLELEIYHKNPGTQDGLKEFRKNIPSNILFHTFLTDVIHDRVWIVDNAKAYAVGTSFGGLGKRLSFILDLPTADLTEFKKHLDNIKQSTIGD
ncbi:MAG: hypothetical protein AAF208_13170 [Cyanobacteria bacterium P01_A01_bin.45]